MSDIAYRIINAVEALKRELAEAGCYAPLIIELDDPAAGRRFAEVIATLPTLSADALAGHQAEIAGVKVRWPMIAPR